MFTQRPGKQSNRSSSSSNSLNDEGSSWVTRRDYYSKWFVMNSPRMILRRDLSVCEVQKKTQTRRKRARKEKGHFWRRNYIAKLSTSSSSSGPLLHYIYITFKAHFFVIHELPTTMMMMMTTDKTSWSLASSSGVDWIGCRPRTGNRLRGAWHTRFISRL